jgi:hypothetical protein
MVPAPVGLWYRLDDTEPFELVEPLREQGTGESGRALQALDTLNRGSLPRRQAPHGITLDGVSGE